MMKFSGFADEISAELSEQIRVCKEVGITHFELRGVSGKNVSTWDDAFAKDVKKQLDSAGMGVAAIGSPVGKVPITEEWEPHFEMFKRVVALAQLFGAPMIRVFSYYPTKGEPQCNVLPHRSEVIRRFQEKVKYIANKNVVMVHENERDIYGEKGLQCVDLMEAVNSPKLRSAFDFANFVQAGERPLDNWPGLKKWTTHVHIKDAMLGSGKVVPAGEGDGQILPVLKDLAASGYSGFLSLEPHLAAHGQFSGFSGPQLFVKAAEAVKKLCRDNGIPLAGA